MNKQKKKKGVCMWELCIFLKFPEETQLTLDKGFFCCLLAVVFCRFPALSLFYGMLQCTKRQHKLVFKHVPDGDELMLVLLIINFVLK